MGMAGFTGTMMVWMGCILGFWSWQHWVGQPQLAGAAAVVGVLLWVGGVLFAVWDPGDT